MLIAFERFTNNEFKPCQTKLSEAQGQVDNLQQEVISLYGELRELNSS
jgi:exonuclease VII small subunit